MDKLSKRNKDLYENEPEALVSVTVKIPYEIHKLILDMVRAIQIKETKYNNAAEYESAIAKEFSKWRATTPEGRSAGLEAFNIASISSQLEARRYLREEFFRCNPELKKKPGGKNRSPTGYSREDVGRVVTEAVEIARLKLRNKYHGG